MNTFFNKKIQGIKDITSNTPIEKDEIDINLRYIKTNFNTNINLILFEIIFLILPLKIISENYIEIKVNEIGYNQILSDKYTGRIPYAYVNNTHQSLSNKKINIESINDTIKLKWDYYLTDFSYMFANLTSITSVHINNMFGKDSILSYMFYNCINLNKFTYDTYSDIDHSIIKMDGMFYNCISLTSFDFNNLYFDYYYYREIKTSYTGTDSEIHYSTHYEKNYNYINISYMFYNCQNLKSVDYKPDKEYHIYYMKGMFFNCTTIKSINLVSFKNLDSDYYVDLSNVFYNCRNLESITFSTSFGISDMKNIFYNCTSLKNIDLRNFKSSSYYMNMSNLFYNCYNLTEIFGDFNKFYISDTNEMFYNCISLKSLYFNPYKIKNGINMAKMFYNCNNIEKIIFKDDYIYYFQPNDINSIFFNCKSLKSIDLTLFKTGVNSFINTSNMFYNCSNLESITFSSLPNSFGVNNMDNIFYNCHSLKYIDIRSWKIPNNICNNMSNFFANFTKLETIIGTFSNFNICDTNKMFYNCTSLTSLSFSPYNTIIGINMSKMFYNCNNLQSIFFYNSNSSKFYPSDMNSIFYNCKNLKSINLLNFDSSIAYNISYMFYNCQNMINLNINFENTRIKNMKAVFQNCKSFVDLDLSNFYTSNVEIMIDMFKGCSNLKYLNIKNFDTSKVTDMESMFDGCSNLISLDLNNFNTKNVQYMNKMFYNCSSLEILNFRNINADSLSTMYKMFYNCKKLNYLNIFSLIETSISIYEMFEGINNNIILCIKQKENIPDIFDLMVNKIDNITLDCSDKCYKDGIKRMYDKEENKCYIIYEYENNYYKKCPSRTRVKNISYVCQNFTCDYYYNYNQDNCYNSSIIPEGYYINDTLLKTIDKCYEGCKTCLGNATYCISCNNNSPYLYLGQCYNSCKYDFFIDNDKNLRCKCFEKKCFNCSKESLNLGLCLSCNEGYYPKIDDEIYNNNFINCYKDPEGYYFNYTHNKYMKCYYSCSYCYGYGNKFKHLCSICNSENNISILMDNYLNCYPNCEYNYYINEDNNYTCFNSSDCPPYANLLIANSKQCVKSCNNTKYIYQLNNICYSKCPKDTKTIYNISGYFCILSCPFERPFEKVKEQICVSNCTIMERYYKLCITNYNDKNRINEIQDIILSDIKDDIIDTFDYNFIINDTIVLFEENNIYYQILNTYSTYTNSKITKINLGQCESLLKKYYDINDKDPLYILKIDAFIEGKIGPKVEYEIYYPFNKKNLNQLDLSICEGTKISIGFKLNLSDVENLELYDKNSPYYNDICFSFTNSNGTDITLKDRRQEFSDNNRSLCEEDCNFIGYDTINNDIECSCNTKLNLPFISQISIDKNKLYKFMDIKQIINFNVMKCPILLFNNLSKNINIGFYLFFPIFIIYFLCINRFYKKDYKIIDNIIEEIVFAKKNRLYLLKNRKTEKRKKKELKIKTIIKIYPIKVKTNITKNIKEKKEEKISYNLNVNKIKAKRRTINLGVNIIKYENYKAHTDIINKVEDYKKTEIKNTINSPPIKKPIIIKNDINIERNSILNRIAHKNTYKNNILEKKKSDINTKKGKILDEKEKNKIEQALKYIDDELNNLKYKNAIKYDNRNFLQYYFSLLKEKHIIIKIINKNDYNSFYIKILLLFFNFTSLYVINALFFNDSTMHQIYEDQGDFNFIYQLPQTIYSSIIGIVLNTIMTTLSLSHGNILKIKHEKNIKKIKIKAIKEKNVLYNKFIVFFIINFIFNIIFWYYLGCFCAVYINTQYHLIKDTLISFFISNMTPFGINLIPAIFRIYALSGKSKRKKLLYKFSQILQKF